MRDMTILTASRTPAAPPSSSRASACRLRTNNNPTIREPVLDTQIAAPAPMGEARALTAA